MAKKKRKRQQFKANNKVSYNIEKPNRQARRMGIKPITPKPQEKPKRVSRAAVLIDKVQQARETEKRIVPPGMTYGEYMEYLKEKRQQLDDKMAHLQ